MLDLSNILKIKNKKGQAFSTFQLLIAAVVALALLGVLLPIIMKNVDIGGDPSQAAQSLLKTQINNPGTLAFTESVTFSGKTNSLAASGVTNDTGLDRQQIAFSINGLDGTFSTIGTTAIGYDKTDKGKYMIGILCDGTQDDLMASIKAYSSGDSPKIKFTPEDITFDDSADPGVTNCVIFPKRAQ